MSTRVWCFTQLVLVWSAIKIDFCVIFIWRRSSLESRSVCHLQEPVMDISNCLLFLVLLPFTFHK